MIIRNLLIISKKKSSSVNLKNKYRSDDEIQKTKEIIKIFDVKY